MDVGSNKSRKDTRAVVSLVARYRSPSTFEYVQEACCDVSVGGMFIKSTDPAAAGTLLKLECEADSHAEKIRGVARVVWLRRDNNEYGPSGMGVKFVKLEPGSRETITRIVQENSAAGIEPQSMSSAPESRGKPPGVHAARAKDNGKSNAHPAVSPPPPQSPVAAAIPSPIAPAPAPAPVREAVPSPRPALAVAAPTPEADSGFTAETTQHTGRSSKPEVLAAAPRAALDTHAATAVPQAPLELAPKSGGLRVGWLIAVVLAAIVVYMLAKKDPGVPVETSPAGQVATAPSPAATPATNAAAPAEAKEPAAADPAPPTEVPPAQPEAPAEAQAAPAQDKTAEAPSPQAAPEAQAKAAEPAAQAEAKPAPEAAAPNGAPAVPNAAVGSAEASRPYPLEPGQVPYIMSFVTRPTGASVTIGNLTIVAPGEMDLGAMPPRLKVTAQKEGYESSSVWLDRETEFVRSAGAMRRKVYLTLPALKTAAPAAPAPDAPKP